MKQHGGEELSGISRNDESRKDDCVESPSQEEALTYETASLKEWLKDEYLWATERQAVNDERKAASRKVHTAQSFAPVGSRSGRLSSWCFSAGTQESRKTGRQVASMTAGRRSQS